MVVTWAVGIHGSSIPPPTLVEISVTNGASNSGDSYWGISPLNTNE